jgi:hypothetical protein
MIDFAQAAWNKDLTPADQIKLSQKRWPTLLAPPQIYNTRKCDIEIAALW